MKQVNDIMQVGDPRMAKMEEQEKKKKKISPKKFPKRSLQMWHYFND